MRAVIEKEIALIMHEIMLVHKHIIVGHLIYSYKTFALFTVHVVFLSSSLQSKECLN